MADQKNKKEAGIIMKHQTYVSPQDFKGMLPLQKAIPLGLQHVLAMFVGNLTPHSDHY
ncbi:Xanthine/uracil permease, partial [gut metagenome]